MGRGAADARAPRRAGLLAGAPAHRRDGRPQAATALLVLARRHPDPRPGQPRGPGLRTADDAQHGPAGARPAAPAGRPVVHPARGRRAGGVDPRERGGARRARARRRGRGTCDFASDLAADLPLLTLADVLGVPEPDRWLMYDWSNRVIGFQDPDYAGSAAFDPRAGTAAAREALRHRPAPDADGRMPDPRTRAGMADLYAYAHLLAERSAAARGRTSCPSCWRTTATPALGGGVREHVLAVRRGRQRDDPQRPARRDDRPAGAPGGAGAAAPGADPVRHRRRRDCCAGGRR